MNVNFQVVRTQKKSNIEYTDALTTMQMNNDDAALATADKIFTNIVARVSYVVIWGSLLMRVVSFAICVSQFTPKSKNRIVRQAGKNQGRKKIASRRRRRRRRRY